MELLSNELGAIMKNKYIQYQFIMIKRIKYFFLVSLLFFISCKENRKEQNDMDSFFEEVELPRRDGFKRIYVLKDGIIYQFFLNTIYNTYFKPYDKEYDQEVFFNDFVYNDKISKDELESISYIYSKVDEEFLEKYENADLDTLKVKFCNDDGYRTFIKNDLDNNTLMTLCYIFFKKGYFVGYDDVSGIYVIIKN